jgi:hypothetical protein
MATGQSDEKDAKRAGVWVAIAVALLVIAVIAYNVISAKKPPANIDNSPATVMPDKSRPAPEKPPGS